MNIKGFSLLSKIYNQFSRHFEIILCGLYFAFQIYCVMSGTEWKLALFWGLGLLGLLVLFKKHHSVVLLAMIANSTSVFFKTENLVLWSILLVVPVLILANRAEGRWKSLKYSGWYLLIIISFIVSSVHVFIAQGLEWSQIRLSVKYLAYFLSFYAVYLILSEKNYKTYLIFYMVSGLCFLLVFFVMLKEHPFWVPNRLSINHYVHPNQLSMYMELFFPISFFSLLFSRKNMARLCWGALTFLFLLVLLLAYSKAGLITVVICFVFYLFRKINLKKIIVMCIIVAGLMPVVYQGYNKRMNFKNVDNVISAGARIELYKTSIKVLKENYIIFGIGLNEFSKIKFNFGFKRWLDPEGGMSSHNMYLDFWMGFGLLAFVSFFYILIRILIGLLRMNNSELNGYRYGLAFCIISFLAHGFMDNNLTEGYSTIGFFMLLGFSQFLIEHGAQIESVPITAGV